MTSTTSKNTAVESGPNPSSSTSLPEETFDFELFLANLEAATVEYPDEVAAAVADAEAPLAVSPVEGETQRS